MSKKESNPPPMPPIKEKKYKTTNADLGTLLRRMEIRIIKIEKYIENKESIKTYWVEGLYGGCFNAAHVTARNIEDAKNIALSKHVDSIVSIVEVKK